MLFYAKSGGDVISPDQGISLPEKIPSTNTLSLTSKIVSPYTLLIK